LPSPLLLSTHGVKHGCPKKRVVSKLVKLGGNGGINKCRKICMQKIVEK
jgi:hypothetical protein